MCECGRKGFHLCSYKIRAYHESLTEEQRKEIRETSKKSLTDAIEAGKILKQHGIELVCSV